MKKRKMKKVSGGSVNVALDNGVELGHLAVEDNSQAVKTKSGKDSTNTRKRTLGLDFGGLDLGK